MPTVELKILDANNVEVASGAEVFVGPGEMVDVPIVLQGLNLNAEDGPHTVHLVTSGAVTGTFSDGAAQSTLVPCDE